MIIRAKLYHNKRTYRDIYIDPFINLYVLAENVINAFDFNFDHCFGFFPHPDVYKKCKDKVRYESFYDIGEEVHNENTQSVARTIVGDIFKNNKDKWWMLFDYGDDWIFELECKVIEDEYYLRSGTVIKTSGEAPVQYPECEDEDEDYAI